MPGPVYSTPYSASNDLKATGNRARIGGSSFTVFTWQGQAIAFAQQITHQSPQPVGSGTVPIHPLDSPYPNQLVTPQATTMGTLVLQLYELYGANVWERLYGLGRDRTSGGQNPAGNTPVDLANIFASVANSAPIHITRIVRPPSIGGKQMSPYTQEFHNCVVSGLDDGETIEIGTMEVSKILTVNYTHLTRGGFNGLLGNSPSTATGDVAGAPGSA